MAPLSHLFSLIVLMVIVKGSLLVWFFWF
jgi:hypothetical protein